jgi:CubicO group peptidase (beta-lactamase class C family)
MKKTYPLIFLLFIFKIGFAQSKFEELNSYLDSLTANDKFSGFVLVAKDGKPVFQKGYGYADRINRFPNTNYSQFCLSSTSKLFTGTAIVKLMQDGKISANDTIGTYIKGLTYGSKITIHHLLTHSSGLRDFYEDSNFTYVGVKKCSDIIKFICNQKLSFNPGEKVKYSTSGMILLGAVIEKVSGLTYQQYLTNTFFIPLGMKNTTFVNYQYVQYEQLKPSSYAIGYIKDSTGKIVIRRRSWDSPHEIPLSAGGIWSSAEDLLKFDNAIYSHKILNKKYLKLMIESKVQTEWPDTDFGYLWININRGKPTRAVGHAGNAGGHHNTFFRYDKDSTTIIILTNFGFVNVFEVSSNIEKIIFE